MKIETYSLGELQTNCYLIYDDGEAVVIDPADDGVFIAEKVYEKGLTLKAILATHGHFDHILGAGELQMILKAPFYIHKKDEFLLKQASDSAKFWLKRKTQNPMPQDIKFLKEGPALRSLGEGVDKISFGNYFLEVIETPGHTPGSVCFKLGSSASKSLEESVLFTGDTLFRGAIGRYDFSYSNKEDLKKSLKKIFKKFPEETEIYSGHGDETILVNEEQFEKWACS